MSDKTGKILAYDIGTGSTKAALVDSHGHIYATANHAYGIHTPLLNYVEQDPEEYWQAVRETTRVLLHKTATEPEAVTAMVFTTQSMGIIAVNRNGKALHSNLTWVDGRAQAQAERINAVFGAEIFGGKSVAPKLVWLKENMPELYENTHRFLGVNGYLCHRATGRLVTELTSAASYGVDNSNNDWNYRLFQAIQIDCEKLSPIICSTDLVGTLTEKAAGELGLTTAVRVFGGCDDVQSAAVGAGAMGEGDAHIYLGSSSWLCVCSKENYPMTDGINTIKSADPRFNLVTGVNQSAGMTLDWVIDTLYGEEKEVQPDIYAYLNEAVHGIPPGSEGLLATPWLYGEATPFSSETTRAAFINLNSRHTKAHMFQAVCEGIGYNLRWTLELYRKKLAISPKQLQVIGGMAQNQQLMQMLANILGLPLRIPDSARFSGVIGAAACAAVGMGAYESLQDLSGMVHCQAVFLPEPVIHAQYEELFSIFQGIYPALDRIYERLNGSKRR